MQLCYVVTKSMLVQKYNSSGLCAKLWIKMGSICYKSTKLAWFHIPHFRQWFTLYVLLFIDRLADSHAHAQLPTCGRYVYTCELYFYYMSTCLIHINVALFSGKLLDFILQSLFLHSCEIKSGSGLRPRLVWLWLVWLLMLQYVFVTAVLENSRRSYPGTQCMLLLYMNA